LLVEEFFIALLFLLIPVFYRALLNFVVCISGCNGGSG